EREDIQKKTFTKWINSQLGKAKRVTITDLFTDLRDGERLLSLLEVLGGLNLKPERGKLRVHHINNLNRALEILENDYNIKLVNISSNDIVDGNPKLTLGLVWSIILHWQVSATGLGFFLSGTGPGNVLWLIIGAFVTAVDIKKKRYKPELSYG
ncbi:hypothetical protein Btru_024692, partial [Bulinus truncatus]